MREDPRGNNNGQGAQHQKKTRILHAKYSNPSRPRIAFREPSPAQIPASQMALTGLASSHVFLPFRKRPPCALVRSFAGLPILALVAYAAWLPAQSFDLDRGREPVVSLDGHWRFHPGDSPQAPGSQRRSVDRAGLRRLRLAAAQRRRSWTAQGYRDMSGYAWYRFTSRFRPDKSPLAAAGAHRHLI